MDVIIVGSPRVGKAALISAVEKMEGTVLIVEKDEHAGLGKISTPGKIELAPTEQTHFIPERKFSWRSKQECRKIPPYHHS